MANSLLPIVFVVSLCFATAIRLWLLKRQHAHVTLHRDAVPAAFSNHISLAQHQKAADYTRDKLQANLVALLFDTAILLSLTLGGGLSAIESALRGLEWPELWHGVALFGAFGLVTTLLGLPFEWHQLFVIEERYGFNKQTIRGWLIDGAKGLILGAFLGIPLLAAILWFISRFPDQWWIYTWCVWMAFNLVLLWAYPVLIAPLFNRFTPLDDRDLVARLNALLQRCGFRASGLFVMDGSRRSAHGNAYFTGFGAAKRIVLFDTLLKMLSPGQIEAVLAHELGHFVHRHVLQRIVLSALLSGAGLWLIANLMALPGFSESLGVGAGGTATGLLLALLELPYLSFPLAPLFSLASRRHEFQADRYAAAQSSATDLIDALVTMYRENAATLTPDPLHSAFYDSHPPASLRIAALRRANVEMQTA